MRGLMSPAELIKTAKERGQSTVAITDHATFAGMWASLKAANSAKVKLIAGCEFNFVDNEDAPIRSLVLLAKNQIGYRNLLTLGFRAYDNYRLIFKKATPIISWEMLEKYKEGVICITSDGNGVINQSLMDKNQDKAIADTKRLYEIFGHDNFALELQPHALKRRESAYSGPIDQVFLNRKLKKIAEEVGCRCVVTTDSYYKNKEDSSDQDLLIAIGSGQPVYSGNRLKFDVPEFYVKNSIEVASFFVRHHKFWGAEFIQSLFDNSVFLAGQCEHAAWIDPKYSNESGKELPEFPVKDESCYEDFIKWKAVNFPNAAEDVAYMRYKCSLALDKRIPEELHKQYLARLDEEYDVLEYHGFSSYMLIVADFVNWAKDHDIRVGPGRGSASSSLVAYLLNIHVIDPIKYKLIFARFHNKNKTSFPDIDIDFPSSGRDSVKEYIRNKYGADYFAYVSNVSTITPKVYARDISRSFEFGDMGRQEAVQIGNNIADSLPSDIKTVTKALEDAPLFAEYAKQYPQLERYAKSIGGQFRNWATHAGGIIIGKRPLVGLVPLRVDHNNHISLEYDKDTAEENGLVKMDTLAVSTLDIITNTYALIKESGKPMPPDPIDFEVFDQKTYDLIGSGKTFCVFQLGGTAMQLCRDIKPQNVSDISHINALMRPSAASFRSDFIKTRNGNKELEIMHPLLQRAFGDTYGFGLYEECLMYLAQDVAGWDQHEADRLRKLTKQKGKNADVAKKWRQEFIDNAVERNSLTVEMATSIWDDVVQKFAGYGFNNSHSVSYSVITYYTAYLKAHYPLEFLVANLMSEINSNSAASEDNVLRIKDELKQFKINIVTPDINKSEGVYKIINDNSLMAGLNSIKYMGKDSIPNIIENRPYTSLEDFLTKIDSTKVRAGAIQAMAASGCFDSIAGGKTRKQMFYYAADFKNKLKAHLKKNPETRGEFNYPWPEEEEWNVKDLFALETYYLGEGVSGSVQDRYPLFFRENVINFSKLNKALPYSQKSTDEKQDRRANTYYLTKYGISGLKGIITHLFSFKVKKEDSPILGQEMARIDMQDIYGNELSVVAFPDSWNHIKNRIVELSGSKHEIGVGMAIFCTGAYQYESEHVQSFIIEDILDYQPLPSLPKDLKARKIKIPRKKRAVDVKSLDQNSLIELLESEMVEDGFASLNDD